MPTPLPPLPDAWAAARDPATLLDAAVADGLGSGAAAFAVAGDGPPFVHFAGTHAHGDPRPIGPDAVFDLASLTKVLATTLVAQVFVSRGELSLHTTVTRLWPRPLAPTWGRVSVLDLLNHRAGLVAHVRFWERLAGAPDPYAAVLADITGDGSHRDRPSGFGRCYTDLGFLLLGRLLEIAGGAPLHVLTAECLSAVGLPASTLHFRPIAAADARPPDSACVATENDDDGRPLRGVVHDENARFVGGVAGHAGLFGTLRGAADLARVFAEAYHGGVAALDADTVRTFATPLHEPPGEPRALGWDVPSPAGSSAGGAFAPDRAIGHLGFTGTSVWIDPAARRIAVLLTNRVHPHRNDDRIRALRPRFHDLLVETGVL